MATKSERKYTTITIPSALFKKLKMEIKDTGFSSVSDYATYILRETIIDMRISKSGNSESENNTIINKLKTLGYVK